MAGKFALIIGNSQYEDSSLGRLTAPAVDVRGLEEVLKAPDIGQFDDVTTLVDEDFASVRRAVARFYDLRQRDDLLFLYFSGHGVKDEQGHLFLALRDTDSRLLSGTAIETLFISGQMDRSFSKRQVLVLDCCHSGAFAHGTKAAQGLSVGTAEAFEGTGLGRVVLTATDATQYALEGNQVIGNAQHSLFTHFLIDGLKTGAADRDRDGLVTIDELYEHVREQVLNTTPRQMPQKWTYRQPGEIVLAKNPVAKASRRPARAVAPEIKPERPLSPPSENRRTEKAASDIFISYAREDQARAKSLAAVLRDRGWSVWWDRKIAPGEQFDVVIERELGICRCAIVLWSKHSVNATWVRNEARRAAKRKVLVPIFIDEVDPPLEFENLQAADLTTWETGADHPELEGIFDRVRALLPVANDARVEEENEAAEKAERQRVAEAKRRAAEEAERRRVEAERRRAAEEAEQHRQAEAKRREAEEAERRRVEEAERRAAAEAERRRVEAERKRAAEEAERRQLEAERKRAAEEAERKRIEEEERQAAAEAERRRVEAERKRAAEQAERKRAAEEAERKGIEEEKRQAAAEAERQRIEKEERQAAAEAERRQQLEAERKRAAEEAERQRIEEEKRRAAEEAERRRVEADRKRAAEEAERKRIEEEERQAAAEAERRRVEAERKRAAEQAERAAEEAERQRIEQEERQAAEEAERQRVEAERQRIEEEKRQAAAEAERRQLEVERKRAAEEAERQRVAEAKRRAAEEAEWRRAEAARELDAQHAETVVLPVVEQPGEEARPIPPQRPSSRFAASAAAAVIVVLLAVTLLVMRRPRPEPAAPPTVAPSPTDQVAAPPQPPTATTVVSGRPDSPAAKPTPNVPSTATTNVPSAPTADAKSRDAKSRDAKSTDAKSADGKSPDVKSPDVKSPDVKSPDLKSSDTTKQAARLEELRATAKRHQQAGRSSQALDAAAEGLKLDARDAPLRGIVSALLQDAQASADRAKQDAQASADRARQEARTAKRDLAATPEFTQASEKYSEAAKLHTSGDDVAAVRSLWAAADDYAKATNRYRQLAADAADARRKDEETRKNAEDARRAAAADDARRKQLADEAAKKTRDDEARRAEEDARLKRDEEARQRQEDEARRKPIPGDEQRIRQLLNDYKAAYEQMDAAAVNRLHPSLSQNQLANTFKQYRAFAMSIADVKLLLSGNSAVVTCTITTNIRPRVGDTQSFTRPTTLRMQKTGESWVIVDRR